MIDTRLAGIDERLLPAKRLRPPLAVDKKREQTSENPIAAKPTAARPTDGGEWVTVVRRKKKDKSYAATVATAPASKKPAPRQTQKPRKPKLITPRTLPLLQSEAER
ncbi:unnamed protein product [Euphydryas editha]|uniref:Uncharacterized protein n=1 Tax=Euphydryas editha TaxID=104508 RepID=A0AAU9V954_EUPED|nr:unnamed protein product [Euphydryas editha]